MVNPDGSLEVDFALVLSFWRKPESSNSSMFWMPDKSSRTRSVTGMTDSLRLTRPSTVTLCVSQKHVHIASHASPLANPPFQPLGFHAPPVWFRSKPSSSGGGPGEVLPIRGELFLGLFIFFHVEENEPKEDARVPLNPVRRRVGRRARKLAALRQVRALIPPTVSMLGAEQRENHKAQQIDMPSSAGVT